VNDMPRLVAGLNAEYVPAQWDGKDTSGIRCVGTTVLVLMDVCAETNTGGIILPPDVVEKHTAGSERGVLIAFGNGAFLLNEDMSQWSGPKPVPGDRVYIEKYAGKQIKGIDGKVYRLMSYQCIGAIYKSEADLKAEASAAPAVTPAKKIETAKKANKGAKRGR